jgi:hypothetical protein
MKKDFITEIIKEAKEKFCDIRPAGAMLGIAQDGASCREEVERFEKFLTEKLIEAYKNGVNDLNQEINNDTLISELYGWKNVLDYSVERVLKRLTDYE